MKKTTAVPTSLSDSEYFQMFKDFDDLSRKGRRDFIDRIISRSLDNIVASSDEYLRNSNTEKYVSLLSYEAFTSALSSAGFVGRARDLGVDQVPDATFGEIMNELFDLNHRQRSDPRVNKEFDNFIRSEKSLFLLSGKLLRFYLGKSLGGDATYISALRDIYLVFSLTNVCLLLLFGLHMKGCDSSLTDLVHASETPGPANLTSMSSCSNGVLTAALVHLSRRGQMPSNQIVLAS